ncbi:hypothetical protein [Natronorubrum bangense]|uniref:DUF8139 domain-containing protein n=2 Tax=Natronorubrum bangense TaxID=61858 RepID=L9WK59_9EURY|nr:hypothetical protein C494_07510 [Natronorubrum bangense JCM 10635]QCC55462.1 hypothetical protein DV706_13885 [Natronorubrum bangense]
MPRFTEGDRVRVDIPNEADPDHDRYHGRHGTVVEILEDDAAEETGREQDAFLFRIEFDSGDTMDFRGRDLRPPLD